MMAQRPRQARSDGVRQLLIDYREHRLPKSTPPPPWSAPRGGRDELLDDLKAGRPVVVVSPTLLCAMMAAELPEATYRRFGYGGADWGKAFRLDEHNRLIELADDG
jgi:hypothetical protein